MKAASRYKQVRITLTETPSRNSADLVGIDVRVMVKPLEAAWTMRHTITHSRLERQLPLDTLDAVYEAILEFLARPPFPESHAD